MRNHTKFLPLALIGSILSLLGHLPAVVLVEYTFSDLTGEAQSTAAGVTASPFAAVHTTTFYPFGSGQAGGNAQAAGWQGSTGVGGGRYFSFQLESVDPLSLESLAFDFARSSSNEAGFGGGPIELDVTIVLDGTEMAVLQRSVGDNYNPAVVQLNDLAAGELVEIRFYGSQAASSTGVLRVDNIQLTGTVVPEPGTIGLVGMGLVAMAIVGLQRSNRRIES